jgi:hypothetical protein
VTIGTNSPEILAQLTPCHACGGNHDPAIADAVHRQIIDDLKTKTQVTDDMVTAIHSAVIGFTHKITHEEVVLLYNPKEHSKNAHNALGQMHQRVRKALMEYFNGRG